MPDLDINIHEVNSTVFFSKIVELFSCTQMLVVPAHHEFAKEITSKIRNELSNDSIAFLDGLTKLQYHGLELFDFILFVNIHEDVELFLEKLNHLNQEEIIAIFTMDQIDEKTIKKIIARSLTDKEVEALIPYSFKERIDEIADILYDSKNFIKKLVLLLTEINQSQAFNEQLHSLGMLYQDSINKLREELKFKKPRDLGQEIMNKTFKNVYPYKEYYFTPSYFISPHRLRVHNENINHIIYDLRRDHLYLNKVGTNISNIMKILSDRTRLEILRQLSFSPTYGKVLANALDLTTATISHHLDQLKSIDLIREEKVKNIKYYSVNKEEIDKAFELINLYISNKL